MVRAAILGGYIVNEKADDFTFHELQLQVPGIDEDANRASIITMYEHRVPPLGGDHKPRARPSMLFTGDAFEFDFCESMMGRLSENIWNQKDEFVDILKVGNLSCGILPVHCLHPGFLRWPASRGPSKCPLLTASPFRCLIMARLHPSHRYSTSVSDRLCI